MKTFIKTIFAAVLTLTVLSSAAFANNTLSHNNVTVLNATKSINKIIVSGNVVLILVQAENESIKVYDSYYAKNALVQEENGVLRISSFATTQLTVAVYVSNLDAIEASGNAVVKTIGKLNLLTLAVTLKDNATANINANTVSLFTSVNDNGNLHLSGTSEDYTAILGSLATLSKDQFTAEYTNVSSMPTVYAKTKSLSTLEGFIAVDEASLIGKL